MNIGYLLWLIGVVIAVVIGLSVFHIYEVPVVMDQLRAIPEGTTKALFLALALVTISKLL
jgi:hypothetical protein